jgi:hypothetical protein
MRPYRIALANLAYPASPADAVTHAKGAITRAGMAGAGVV